MDVGITFKYTGYKNKDVIDVQINLYNFENKESREMNRETLKKCTNKKFAELVMYLIARSFGEGSEPGKIHK